MSFPDSLLLTSAIPYVNSDPHLGHALELVQGDALARYARQHGRDVRFTSGTDDNSSKNVRAAARARTTPRELVARHGAEFRRLASVLDITHDDFIHTARDPRHAPAVHALWARCAQAGDVYRKAYRGLYCVGCEQFVREGELVNGGCAVHPAPLELVEEENWFFRLSRYETPIYEAITQDHLQILPEERKTEVVRFIERGLEDFSISRNAARAGDWGITVPGDDAQVIYVWFDALASYVSVLGYPQAEAFSRYWQASPARVHLIGKDITRFHAVYWPGILLSAGLPLPTAILVHGFITSHGQKLGKSLGNAVDPFALVGRYGADAVRYYLLAHLHTTKDGDFREDLLRTAYSSELAGKLGNLVQRVCALCVQNEVSVGQRDETSPLDSSLVASAERARRDVSAAVGAFALHDALHAIFELVTAANRYADSTGPWQLAKAARAATDANTRARLLDALRVSLRSLVAALNASVDLLDPFLPGAAARIRARLIPEPKLGEPLFPALRAP